MRLWLIGFVTSPFFSLTALTCPLWDLNRGGANLGEIQTLNLRNTNTQIEEIQKRDRRNTNNYAAETHPREIYMYCNGWPPETFKPEIKKEIKIWNYEMTKAATHMLCCAQIPSELSAIGAKRGVRSAPLVRQRCAWWSIFQRGGAGRGWKFIERAKGKNPRGGAKKRVNRLLQKFNQIV